MRHPKVDRRRFAVIYGSPAMDKMAMDMGFTTFRSTISDQLQVQELLYEHIVNVLDDSERNDVISSSPKRSISSILPRALVLQIFEHVVGIERSGFAFRLAAVCRLWRTYALTHPQLW